MKKRIYKYIMYVPMVFVLLSCGDFLDLDPQQSLSSDEVFDTQQELENALIGAYNAYQDTDLGGLNMTIFPDLIAGNADWAGSFPTIVDVTDLVPTAQNGEVRGLWEDGYSVINAANTVISSVEALDAEAISDEDRNLLIGDAYFLKALVQFDQVRYFGRPFGSTSSTDLGVPIRNEAVFSLSDYEPRARNTVEQVYTQIINDLGEAINRLPATSADGRANSLAATAVLARVRFQQRDYTAAESLAGQIIDGGFTLNADPTEFYSSEFSGESIFELAATIQDNPGATFFTHRNLRDGDTRISSSLSDAFDDIVTPSQRAALAAGNRTFLDLRTRLTEDSDGNLGGMEHPLKFEDFVAQADNSYIIRLAEFMLMRAETLVINTNSVNAEAIDLLNQVRLRALRVFDANGDEISNAELAFSASDFSSPAELQEAIILERRIELFLEGNYWHDLTRLQRTIRGVAPGTSEADLRFIWPIPQRALDTNSLLEVNPRNEG